MSSNFNQVLADLPCLDSTGDEEAPLLRLVLVPWSYANLSTTLTYGKTTVIASEITSALLYIVQIRRKVVPKVLEAAKVWASRPGIIKMAERRRTSRGRRRVWSGFIVRIFVM